jgi:hypothetical protein
MTGDKGYSIDELETLTRPGSSMPFAGSTDEAADKFVKMTSQIDALDVFAKTGRIPSSTKHGSAGNFYSLLQSIIESSDQFDQNLIEKGFDVEEFLSNPKGTSRLAHGKNYLEKISSTLSDEELHYKEMYEAEIASQTPDTPQVEPSMTAAERRQAAIDRGKAKGSKKAAKKPVIKNSPPIGFDDDYLTDDYLASLDEVMSGGPPPIDDDYLSSLGEAKVVRHEPTSVIGEAVEEVGERFEPVAREVAETVAKKPMSPLEQRVKAAVIQAVDLAADISSDMSKSRSTLKTVRGEVGAVGEMLVSSQTAQNVISSMEKARGVVSGLSRNKKIGYTLGGLGAIGAVTNRSRDKRRR